LYSINTSLPSQSSIIAPKETSPDASTTKTTPPDESTKTAKKKKIQRKIIVDEPDEPMEDATVGKAKDKRNTIVYDVLDEMTEGGAKTTRSIQPKGGVEPNKKLLLLLLLTC